MNASPELQATALEPDSDALPNGTTLFHGQYSIDSYLSSGGFGVTYLAKDSLDRRVVIKECFPRVTCRREGFRVVPQYKVPEEDFQALVRLFVDEARNLAKLDHPNIVGVHQVFEDNGTAYMALDYVRGRELLELIDDGKVLRSPEAVQKLLETLLDTVDFIHGRGILHRDISPDNILIRGDMSPVLIDFGAARADAMFRDRRTAVLAVKDGYSPQEFYIGGSHQDPSSDLYSLAATFHHLIAGIAPITSSERLAAVAAKCPDPQVSLVGTVKGYDPRFLEAIDTALHVLQKNRFDSARAWKGYIRGQDRVEAEDSLAEVLVRRRRQLEEAMTQRPASSPTQAVGPKPKLKVVTAGGKVRSSPRSAPKSIPRKRTQSSEVSKRPTQPASAPRSVTKPRAKPKPPAKAPSKAPLPAELRRTRKPAPHSKPPSPVGDTLPRFTTPRRSQRRQRLLISLGGATALCVIGAFAILNTADIGLDPGSVALADTSGPLAPAPAEADSVSRGLLPELHAGVSTQGRPAELPRPNQDAQFTNMLLSSGSQRPSVVTRLASPMTIDPAIVSAGLPRVADAPAPSTAPALATLVVAGSSDAGPTADMVAPEPYASPFSDTFSADTVVDAAAVMSGWAVDLPFSTSAAAPTLVFGTFENAPDWMQRGQSIATVNGIEVASLEEIRAAIRSVGPPDGAGAWSAVFGIRDAGSADITLREARIAGVRQVALLNGLKVKTIAEGGVWRAVVTESPFDADDALQTGDEIAGFIPTSETLDGPASLVQILDRELAAGRTSFEFAVNRDGDLWVVSMIYSPDAVQ